MEKILPFLACLGLFSCTPQSSTLPRDMAEARIAQPSDLMEAPDQFIVDYRVIEVVNENYMIVQSLGVNYEDEYKVRFSKCHAQGKTPVNKGDTIKVLVGRDVWGIDGDDGYRRAFPPCQQ